MSGGEDIGVVELLEELGCPNETVAVLERNRRGRPLAEVEGLKGGVRRGLVKESWWVVEVRWQLLLAVVE